MMRNFTLQRLSIDLSNQCSKACDFCYNGSFAKGKTMWHPHEVIDLHGFSCTFTLSV